MLVNKKVTPAGFRGLINKDIKQMRVSSREWLGGVVIAKVGGALWLSNTYVLVKLNPEMLRALYLSPEVERCLLEAGDGETFVYSGEGLEPSEVDVSRLLTDFPVEGQVDLRRAAPWFTVPPGGMVLRRVELPGGGRMCFDEAQWGRATFSRDITHLRVVDESSSFRPAGLYVAHRLPTDFVLGKGEFFELVAVLMPVKQ